MQIMRDVLKQAEESRVAIGHFNVGDLVLLKAVFAAAQELKVPSEKFSAFSLAHALRIRFSKENSSETDSSENVAFRQG